MDIIEIRTKLWDSQDPHLQWLCIKYGDRELLRICELAMNTQVR